MSVSEGEYRDSEVSVRDIPRFIDSFKGQLDMSSAEKPASEYKTFNEFFSRRLRPGARPISGDSDDIVVSSADCRLQVYESVDEATRFWVKVGTTARPDSWQITNWLLGSKTARWPSSDWPHRTTTGITRQSPGGSYQSRMCRVICSR